MVSTVIFLVIFSFVVYFGRGLYKAFKEDQFHDIDWLDHDPQDLDTEEVVELEDTDIQVVPPPHPLGLHHDCTLCDGSGVVWVPGATDIHGVKLWDPHQSRCPQCGGIGVQPRPSRPNTPYEI